MLPEAFSRFARGVEARDTHSLLVLRNGRLVYEWHDWGESRREPRHAASLAKGVVGGLALALLSFEGVVALDEPAAVWVPDWREDPIRRRITVRQLATHASGLADARPRAAADAEPWQSRFWDHAAATSPIHVALDEVPVVFPPGQDFGYSNPGFAVLSLVIASALRDRDTPDLPAFLRARLFGPLGIPDEQWSIGYGHPFEIDGLETWATWGGAKLSPEALARVGELLRRRGEWRGRVLPEPVVDAAVGDAGTPTDAEGAWPAPALGWWTNARGRFARLPRDAFLAFGAGHKVLLVVPSLDLVVVRLGDSLDPEAPDRDFWEPLERLLIDPLMEALPPPLPRSEVLAGAWFDPPTSMVCRALGSDNWPLTWLRDGSLFAAYGDGWGFEPRADRKLSLGLARIEGTPADFAGRNLRSPTGERSGDGPAGAKASGVLAVDGVIYLWARNLDNAQLAWSADGGRTWEWGFRFRESFGSPTFLNFGPDYTGARDEFVYVYSQDGPSAYESDGAIVLARVDGRRVRERDAYEFFAGTDASGSPRWTRDLDRRAATLTLPGGCRRSDVVYHPGLARYLMALGYDARGGFGIFEAPEPWGPWRTVYSTRRWDLGDTHSYRLPASWLGGDGHRLALVVSGRDTEIAHVDGFCVRGFRISVF